MAEVGKVLHFRSFDSDGKVVADADETSLTENVESYGRTQKATRELVAAPRAHTG